MTITAKYSGRCTACGRGIIPGTRIEWTKGVGSRHTECPQTETPAPAPRRAAKSSGPCRRCGTYCYGDCTASEG